MCCMEGSTSTVRWQSCSSCWTRRHRGQTRRAIAEENLASQARTGRILKVRGASDREAATAAAKWPQGGQESRSACVGAVCGLEATRAGACQPARLGMSAAADRPGDGRECPAAALGGGRTTPDSPHACVCRRKRDKDGEWEVKRATGKRDVRSERSPATHGFTRSGQREEAHIRPDPRDKEARRCRVPRGKEARSVALARGGAALGETGEAQHGRWSGWGPSVAWDQATMARRRLGL